MFAERGESGGTLPETVQGIITARLDSLPPDEKELLLDAAVLGKTFWRGGLGGEEVEPRLRSLQRKEFIRRERHSAVARESEFSFAHLLIRDVAYAQIPRAERAEKHVRAARWIDSLSGERGEDLAELRAHHYASALELVGRRRRSSGFGPAVDALIAAAQRAEKLFAFAQVERYASRALALVPEGDPRRPQALLALAAAEAELGNAEFHEHANEAAAAFCALDNRSSAAAAVIVGELAVEIRSPRRGHAAAERALHSSATTASRGAGRRACGPLAAADARLGVPGVGRVGTAGPEAARQSVRKPSKQSVDHDGDSA
jgi:hypothetical protein